VKARYVGVCRGCGAYTQPRNGKGDAYAYCKRCHPGAIERRWTQERVLEAMDEWRRRYGSLPSSYDWSPTHARRRGGGALERLERGEWPAPSTVSRLFTTWAAARAEASRDTWAPVPMSPLGSNSISLPKPRQSPAISEVLSGSELAPEPADLQALRPTPTDFAHNSGR
jgi:hypothetical protein